MRLELEKLEETDGKFSQTYQVKQLTFDETDLEVIEPIEVRGHARRRNSKVEMRAALSTKIAVPCGRCLKPVQLVIDLKFAERFVPAVSWRDEEQHELREADLDLATFDGEGIELDDLVKEEILLAVPGHVLCREDCRGLCQVCGADRNESECECKNGPIDSRWEKLRDLQF